MNPSELITFSLYGLLLLIITALTWFVFRKRKKWAIGITALLIIGYFGSYAYYPSYKTNKHAEKYDQIIEYLANNYPEQKFTVRPEQYEAGVNVGTFDINEKDTPDMGITLYVDEDGQVHQTSSWTNSDFPQQQDLWQELEFHYGENYSLDREDVEITKQDQWIEGELTVFALDIDDKPAIAIYEYSQAGYGRLDLQESQTGDFVAAEAEGHIFVYIDKRYAEETVEVPLQNGETISVDAPDNRGKLFIAE